MFHHCVNDNCVNVGGTCNNEVLNMETLIITILKDVNIHDFYLKIG